MHNGAQLFNSFFYDVTDLSGCLTIVANTALRNSFVQVSLCSPDFSVLLGKYLLNAAATKPRQPCNKHFLRRKSGWALIPSLPLIK
jgi:hypothetical protein